MYYDGKRNFKKWIAPNDLLVFNLNNVKNVSARNTKY